MPIVGALIGGGLGLLGSSMQASATRRAAEAGAAGTVEAARIAAEEARFRPIGLTTRLGRSQFTFNPEGRVSGAGYELSPELRAYQDRLLELTGGVGLDVAAAAPGLYAPMRDAAGRLFALGGQYLSESPADVAQRYMTSQLDILAPQRERQLAALRNRAYQTGREGLSVGATGLRPGGGEGLRATNPEMEAYYNAIAQQDAELARQAQLRGQQDLAFGTTLFGTGAGLLGGYEQGLVGSLAPYQSYLGGVTGLESIGQQPLSLGAALGGGNTASAQALLSGGATAANLRMQAAQLNPTASFLQGLGTNQQLTSGLAEGIQGLFGGSSGPAYNQTQIRSDVLPEGFPTSYFNSTSQFTGRPGYGYL